MQITQFLKKDCIAVNLSAANKRELLEKLAAIGAKASGLHEREVFDILLQRERLGTTGTGSGVAIPHGRFTNLSQVHGVFARLNEPVDFQSVDEKPVDLVFMLLAPESHGADHLKALAEVSKLFRNSKTCAALRQSDRLETIYAVLTSPASDAA
ncbi:MAG: PTS IIA-like nitrogen regulatory protein PtsN [Dongiaceae bacterium]